MSELQDKIDAENRQAKRDKARADRVKTVEAVREYITGKVNNVRNKVENARIKAEKRAEERRDRQDFAADSESTY